MTETELRDAREEAEVIDLAVRRLGVFEALAEPVRLMRDRLRELQDAISEHEESAMSRRGVYGDSRVREDMGNGFYALRCLECGADIEINTYRSDDWEVRAIGFRAHHGRHCSAPRRARPLLAYGDAFAEIASALGVGIAGLAPEEAGPRLTHAARMSAGRLAKASALADAVFETEAGEYSGHQVAAMLRATLEAG